MINIDNLQKRYKAILDIPKKDIDFSFFMAIHDYVEFIETNKELINLISSLSSFKYSNPHYLLVEKGRSINSLKDVFKSKKTNTIFIAFFNLWGVYLGIKDFDLGIKKDNGINTSSLTENRERMVKHLRQIGDNETFVGAGYFWRYKNKYHEWTRIIHRHILNSLEREREIVGSPKVEVNEKQGDISYRCDLDNQLAWFVFDDKEMEFKGKRAIVFNFFYTLNKISDEEYKTYHDFNKYLLDNTINTKIDSIAFRQSIDNINKRIKNEIGDIKSVIELKKKNNPKEINQYKWKVKI